MKENNVKNKISSTRKSPFETDTQNKLQVCHRVKNKKRNLVNS